MKRIMGLVLALVSACSLVACLTGNTIASASTAEIVWQVGVPAPPAHPAYKALGFWNEEITKATNGKYGLETFHSGQLGGERDLLEGVSMGLYKAAQPTTSFLCAISDVFNVFEFPYLFRDFDHFKKTLKSDVAKEMMATLEQYGLHCLGLGANGIYSMTNNVRPVKGIADVKGLKIRVMDAPMQVECVNLLGGNGIPMAATEIYTSLQQGAIDGVLTNGPGIAVWKMWEVQKYITNLQCFYVPCAVVVNKDYWETLPEADRAAIQAATDASIERNIQNVYDEEMVALDTFVTEGMELITFDEYDFDEFVSATSAMFDKHPEYKDYFDRIRAIQ
jgi:tripartite ATP-independent transporter DctP family solute receptor